MLHITDMTLSCIESFHPSSEQLKQLFVLLNNVGADFIEMPVLIYEQLRPETSNKIVLRLTTPGEAAGFPEISRFVCRKNGFTRPPLSRGRFK